MPKTPSKGRRGGKSAASCVSTTVEEVQLGQGLLVYWRLQIVVSQNYIIKRCCVCPRLLTGCSRLGVPEALACDCHSEHRPSTTRTSAVTGAGLEFLVRIADTRQQKPLRELLRNRLYYSQVLEGAQHTEDHTIVGDTERERGGLPLSWSKDGVWGCMGHSSLKHEQELGFSFPPRCQFSRFPTVFRKGLLSVGATEFFRVTITANGLSKVPSAPPLQ